MIYSRPRLEALETRDLLSYALTDLGTFGHTSAAAVAVNDRAQVAVYGLDFDGSTFTDNTILWRRARARELEPPNGVTDFLPQAMSSNGWVVGIANRFSDPQPIVAAGHRTFTLGFPGRATGVNDRGEVVGVGDNPIDGFLWHHGRLTDLGRFQPRAINDEGEIIGNVSVSEADVWLNGSITSLPIPAGAIGATAIALNDQGEVVGEANYGDFQQSVFWDAEGVHVLEQHVDLIPVAVNDSGAILGARALYDHGAITLAAALLPGWHNVRFTGINDRGQIVGAGQPPGENAHAFLLTPDGRDMVGLSIALNHQHHDPQAYPEPSALTVNA